MRVAYLINQYPKVSHTFIRREIQALEAQGVAVDRYAIRGWADELADEGDLAERGLTRYVLKVGPLSIFYACLLCLIRSPMAWFRALKLTLRLSSGSARPWPVHLVYFSEACQLFNWWRRYPVQHVHAHFGTNSAEVVMLAHALGGPRYSFTVHGPEEFDKPESLHLAEKIFHSSFVVAVSSFGRSQLLRQLPHAHWFKVKVVHCGLDKAFHDVDMVPVPSTPRLVCVGRLCEQKGQLLLIEAAVQLRAAGYAFELVLAGDGEMRLAIEDLIAHHDLCKHVRITGWISPDQVRAELLAARALVVPSFAEGLPVVIMEAMALHRPVLSTYVAGIPELVQNGLHGWLFPAGNVDALTKSMGECLKATPAKLQFMGDAGYARARDRHSADKEASKLAALFMQASNDSEGQKF